jgi:D-3-phosphoglycerate dehydrogenase / 2-oxoglutarate reductase
MKVVIAEKIANAALKLFPAPQFEVIDPEEFARDPVAALQDADALIVRSAVQADEKLLANARQLKVIGRAGVGVDNVDVGFATRRGIVVMNAPGASSVAVAELTLGLMLAMARHLSRADQTTRAGQWEKKSLQGMELRGKTLGIIGMGRIGAEVATRAFGFGMKVAAADPYLSPARAHELGVQLVSLDELYGIADYISLHLALTPQTSGMLNASAFEKMKDGVRIVNCARGELINDHDLEQALRSGKVAGAALDVFSQEPPKGSALLTLPKEAQEAVGIQIAQQMCDYFRDGIAQNAVNLPSLTDLEYQQLRPYLDLATRLGKFIAQLFCSNLQQIQIEYEGDLGNWKTNLIRSSLVASVLQLGSDEPMNVINAQAMADARGVLVREVHSARRGTPNAIRVTLSGASGNVEARGTLVHENEPRLIELDGVDIEAQLEGRFIAISNDDSPGVIGRIGTILGEAGVNIARMSLGRNQAGALAMVQVDGKVPAELLEKLRKSPSIRTSTLLEV